MLSHRRLQQDFRQLINNPLQNIRAYPDSENILLWHFILFGDGVYEGGQYYGQIIYPEDYPHSPPDMKMLTPSGRFEPNKKICMTMTSFHKKQWSPTWTASSLLLGLQSFFYDESPRSIGSIHSSDEERRALARKSVAFNSGNKTISRIIQDHFSDLVKRSPDEQKMRKRKVESDTDGAQSSMKRNKNHETKSDKPVQGIEVIEILD